MQGCNPSSGSTGFSIWLAVDSLVRSGVLELVHCRAKEASFKSTVLLTKRDDQHTPQKLPSGRGLS